MPSATAIRRGEYREPASRFSSMVWAGIWERLRTAWAWRFSPRVRDLRLSERLDHGERRLVAVVEFGRQRFLIAATANSVALLSRLPPVRIQTREGGTTGT